MVVCDDCQGYLNPALAADAAVRRGDTILLVQRKYPPNPGSWVLPGGFVDRDEDPEHAVVRELKEEAGLDGKQPKLLMVMGDPKRDERKHVVSIVYQLDVEESQVPVAGDDAADARFWPIDEILGQKVQMAGDHLEIVKNWLSLTSDS